MRWGLKVGVALLSCVASAPAFAVHRGVSRADPATSATGTAPTDASPEVQSGRLRPERVVFGEDVVRVADRSGAFADVTPPHEPDEYVYDAFFLDRDHGWVGFNDPAAAAGRLVRTDDGGRTWEPTNLTARVHQSAGSRGWIHFRDRRFGWVVTYAAAAPAGGIYRTSDGGRSWSDWTDLPEPGPVRFQNAEHGWLASYYGGEFSSHLYETADGGATWVRRDVPPPDGHAADELAYRLPWFDGARGVLPVTVGDDRAVFYTSDDAGRTWRTAHPTGVTGGSDAALAVASLSTWWAVGGGGTSAAVTTDGGRTWTTRGRTGLPATIIDLEATDDRTAWAVAFDPGQPLRLYAASDAGDTWEPVSGN